MEAVHLVEGETIEMSSDCSRPRRWSGMMIEIDGASQRKQSAL